MINNVNKLLNSDLSSYEIAKKIGYTNPHNITLWREDNKRLEDVSFKYIKRMAEIGEEME